MQNIWIISGKVARKNLNQVEEDYMLFSGFKVWNETNYGKGLIPKPNIIQPKFSFVQQSDKKDFSVFTRIFPWNMKRRKFSFDRVTLNVFPSCGRTPVGVTLKEFPNFSSFSAQ